MRFTHLFFSSEAEKAGQKAGSFHFFTPVVSTRDSAGSSYWDWHLFPFEEWEAIAGNPW